MKRESKQRVARCRRCRELAPVERDLDGQQIFAHHTWGGMRCSGVGEFVAARRNRKRMR